MNIYIASDHAGFELKEKVKKYLDSKDIPYGDFGNTKFDINDDYPDFGKKIGSSVSNNKGSRGILICGSSYGICIVANKFKNVRAVSVRDEIEAKISRMHNDANIICLSGGATKSKTTPPGMPFSKVKKIIDSFLETKVSDDSRHKRRIDKIRKIEKENLK